MNEQIIVDIIILQVRKGDCKILLAIYLNTVYWVYNLLVKQQMQQVYATQPGYHPSILVYHNKRDYYA